MSEFVGMYKGKPVYRQPFYGGTASVVESSSLDITVEQYTNALRVMAGEKWKCHYCGSMQGYERETCTQCGGERRG